MLSRLIRTVALILVAPSVIWVAPARAAIDCTGTITNLSLQLTTEGYVTLGLSSGPSYTYFCAINTEINGVAPIVCRTMFATLTAAKLAGKRVLIRFYDHNSCASVPNWGLAGTLGRTQLPLD